MFNNIIYKTSILSTGGWYRMDSINVQLTLLTYHHHHTAVKNVWYMYIHIIYTLVLTKRDIVEPEILP